MKNKKYFAFDKNLNLKQNPPFKTKKKVRVNNLLLAKYFNIGYYLVTPLIIGVFLGYFLSRATGVKELMVIAIVFGTMGTFYNLFKLTKE
jgi:F0F1-type ATP synthase assembly protein I